MRNMNLLNYTFIFGLLSCFVLNSCSCSGGRQKDDDSSVQVDTLYPLGFCTDSLDLREGSLKSGEVFANLVSGLGLSLDQANKLAMASDTVFDMRQMKAGNRWKAYYEEDSLMFFVYEADIVHTTVFKCFEPFKVWNVEKPVETKMMYSDVDIETSLWNDMSDAGTSPLIILQLSDIYAWTVDFFGLQQGDRFRVLYNQSFCEGEPFDIEDIYYAEFTHDGKTFPAIRFDQGDGGNLYWNDKGESMRKAFLKAPLHFSRISSKFSYSRRHPVTGKVRPHTGVDYAAPKGTPVVSIGDGTVISRGWGGGGGNTVKIRHNSVYTTAYLHLSGYGQGIKTGARVRQGQVIGYVGSTGMSTGPHLDFRVWKNGSPINPLTVSSPPADPIRKDSLASFTPLVAYYSAKVDSLDRVLRKK